ncbi:hypothetical protein JCM18750_13060 [Halostagnicola bangensis]
MIASVSIIVGVFGGIMTEDAGIGPLLAIVTALLVLFRMVLALEHIAYDS